MDEQLEQRDAIDVDDFVYAATGARIRRMTMPDGTHWFPAVDVAGSLGYADTRDALRSHVPPQHATPLADLVRIAAGSTRPADDGAQAGPDAPAPAEEPPGHAGPGEQAGAARAIATQGLKRSMRMVNLQGLVQLVNGSSEPTAGPFQAWVGDLVATIQRDGSYALEPAPAHPGCVMPQEIVDIIVRLEERTLRLGEEFAAWEEGGGADAAEGPAPGHDGVERGGERDALLREARRVQRDTARALSRIADSLERRPFPAQRTRPPMTPQELLDTWHADRLPVTGDVRAVAAYLAPALVRGGARYRLEEIARRTGLTVDRVRDSVDQLVGRGCVRQTRSSADGARIFLLPE
ncbi:BRO family protein [Streptomyces sp. NPDC008121]|uniref:BRO family protein n=1 Tax=Streptomyces sp. NPDC008121 TaxID=3364809 RepID=UPI0036EB004E